MKKSKLYRILRPLIKFITNIFFTPKYYGKELIPQSEGIILAGNHTNNLDCLLVISATKRNIHFLAKEELWHGPKKIIFSHMGLIPVNRKKHNPLAIVTAENYLNNNEIIGIFPEGTTEKGRGLLPFKEGATKIANHTNSKILPFVIKGDYRLFSNNLKIVFGKPYNVKTDNYKDETEKLRRIINKMLEEN